jgi:hypothetical protein
MLTPKADAGADVLDRMDNHYYFILPLLLLLRFHLID